MNPLQHYSEDQLFLLVSNEDDQGAYTTLYEKCRATLFYKAYMCCRDEEAAKDAVQELFLYLWKNRKKVHPAKGIVCYLLGAIHKRCADQARQMHRRREKQHEYAIGINTITGISPLEIKELGHELDAAMAMVSHNSLVAFIKHYIERKPMQEIAAEMNINVQSAKNHVHRALKVLRENLKKP